jgi:hypothetical protein
VRPCLSIPGYKTRYDDVDLVTIREVRLARPLAYISVALLNCHIRVRCRIQRENILV